jgi:hypothetical protein
VEADLALTGRVIGAEEALGHGIVSRVVEAEELDAVALEVAEGIAKRSSLAVRMAEACWGRWPPRKWSTACTKSSCRSRCCSGRRTTLCSRPHAEGRDPEFRGPSRLPNVPRPPRSHFVPHVVRFVSRR